MSEEEEKPFLYIKNNYDFADTDKIDENAFILKLIKGLSNGNEADKKYSLKHITNDMDNFNFFLTSAAIYLKAALNKDTIMIINSYEEFESSIRDLINVYIGLHKASKYLRTVVRSLLGPQYRYFDDMLNNTEYVAMFETNSQVLKITSDNQANAKDIEPEKKVVDDVTDKKLDKKNSIYN